IRHAASVRPEPGSNSPKKVCHQMLLSESTGTLFVLFSFQRSFSAVFLQRLFQYTTIQSKMSRVFFKSNFLFMTNVSLILTTFDILSPLTTNCNINFYKKRFIFDSR
ncbi:hypothetical protein, partial [Aeribacillus pallidus]|uniref:hypothetical protein n=1 Tax=Aeribacillus pallidus TaxID=33936 RepID=UPI001A91BA26